MKKAFLFCWFIITTMVAAAVVKPVPTSVRIYYPTYDLKKDKPWLDSIKRIVSRNFEVEANKKNNWKKELIYINSCVALGSYYERLFDKKKLPNMSTAIYYYNKVIDLGRFPDDSRYFKGLAIRTTLFRKLSTIYFKGKGVKKDRDKSLDYALRGVVDGELYEIYSKRYFNTTAIVIKPAKEPNYEMDSIFYLQINPFAKRAIAATKGLLDKNLAAIAMAFKKRNNLLSEILIEENSLTSARDQAFAQRIVGNIKNYLAVKEGIPPDLIYTNVNVGDEPAMQITVNFIKKGKF